MLYVEDKTQNDIEKNLLFDDSEVEIKIHAGEYDCQCDCDCACNCDCNDCGQCEGD